MCYSVRGGRHRSDNIRNVLYFGPMLQVRFVSGLRWGGVGSRVEKKCRKEGRWREKNRRKK